MKTINTPIALGFLAVAFAAGCGIENSLVGGRCRDGMVLEGDTCVTPIPALVLITPNVPVPSASTSASPSPSPSPSASGTVSGTVPSSSATPPIVTPPPTQSVVDPPFPPPPPPPGLVCAPPLVECRGACISVASDPANCGACGKICPSNICVDGLCQGAMPGDVVLIGHDYTNANVGSSQAKVLANALGIPTTDPIRVLSYEEGAPPPTVAQAKLVASAAILGRSVKFVRATSAASLRSTTLERDYDIVLIHDASSGDPVVTGTSWSSSLGEFTMKGGVVVALDRGTSPMPALLTSSGLLTVGGHTLLADGTHLSVTAAADVVGAQVLSPYAGFGPPVTFQGIAAPGADLAWVVRAQDAMSVLGDPVVIHRVVR